MNFNGIFKEKSEIQYKSLELSYIPDPKRLAKRLNEIMGKSGEKEIKASS